MQDYFQTFNQNNYPGSVSSATKSAEAYYKRMGDIGRQQYTRSSEDLSTQNSQNLQDYARMTGQLQQQKTQALKSSSADFARSAAQAAQAYGQRGLLGSGIMKSGLSNAGTQFNNSQNWMNTQYANQQGNLDIQNSRGQERYNLQRTRGGQDLNNYNWQNAGQSAVGIAGATANAQGTYNAGLTGAYGTTEDILKQNMYRRQTGLNPISNLNILGGGVPLY